MLDLRWKCAVVLLGLASVSAAQNVLDPSRMAGTARTVGSFHTPLPEDYIWTTGDAAVLSGSSSLGQQLKSDDWKAEPHYFRRRFRVASRPASATLYVAGPRHAIVWMNGVNVGELSFAGGHHMGFGTMHIDVSSALKTGINVLALEVVRGYGTHHHTNAIKTAWLNSGEVLTAKIMDSAGKTLVMSDGSWRSSAEHADAWETPGFDDSAWKPVVSLGGIESSADFFQWNADAGMYAWPGYLGEAPGMANYHLDAVKTETHGDGVLLDFGRELNGRVVLRGGVHEAKARVSYAESIGELMTDPYLGEVELEAGPGTEARGPKTGFRYALVKWEGNAVHGKAYAEGIYTPVTQVGTFTSNDEKLNRIWETAVYTAHLSMQDSLLDGIKRDRGRWIGDDEVMSRTIADVYGDGRLVKAGLEDSIGPDPVTEHVNGLGGYSAWWVVCEAEYVRRWGDTSQLAAVTPRMLELLHHMELELDGRGIYTAANGGKPFVDWSTGLEMSVESPDERRALHFEYLLAFHEADWLLRLQGKEAEANKYAALADTMTVAAQRYLKDENGAFGDRWQTNAIAVLAGAAHDDAQREAIWRVLGRTTSGRKAEDVITPYYGDYVLRAMAELGHPQEALDWMRAYWGSMIDAGATSFWEAWDPSWTGDDPHAKLQADGRVGYNASLSHGWSSGPASWLMEEVFGVKAASPGFRTVTVRPELAGLAWARGAVATPLGAVQVDVTKTKIAIVVPKGMTGTILLPAGDWRMHGVAVIGESTEDGRRLSVRLKSAGRFEFVKN